MGLNIAMKDSKFLKNLVLWGLLILAVLALSRLKLSVPLYDYVNYWSAGKLNIEGRNPYDYDQLLDLQHQAGWAEEWVIPTWYPPWAMPLLMPLSLLEYSASRFLWFMISICILVFAIAQSWKLYQGPSRQVWVGLLIGVLFTPTIISLMLGQAQPWILLGVMGFLLYIDKPRFGWLAGIFTGLMAIKPQLLILFWIALLFWSYQRKKWQVLAGSTVTILLGVIIAVIFNPDVLAEYAQSIQSTPPFYLATPTIGFYLRAIFGFEKSWLQFISTLIGIIWLLYYWKKNRASWDWLQEMPILMFASIITAPFTWSHDQMILTPALMQAAIWLLLSRKRWKASLILAVFIIANIANLVLHKLQDETWVIWLAPLLLVCYLISRNKRPASDLECQGRA
jgi:hypothetical protein